ncbi:MAG: hypothetical protein P8Y70_11750 [Candidatus Lokiarchaeota archaeon]
MEQFFEVYTYTPWDNLNTKTLSKVKLLSLKSIFKNYPIIEQKFFNDITEKIGNQSHYSKYQTIRRVVGPNEEDYDISNWNFLWARDDQRRIYQFLIQRIKKDEKIKFLIILAAKGNSIAQDQKLFPISEEDLKKKKVSDYLKSLPNIEGQWFPNFAPKCPICGSQMVQLTGYRTGFGKLVCPQCGYNKL